MEFAMEESEFIAEDIEICTKIEMNLKNCSNFHLPLEDIRLKLKCWIF